MYPTTRTPRSHYHKHNVNWISLLKIKLVIPNVTYNDVHTTVYATHDIYIMIN